MEPVAWKGRHKYANGWKPVWSCEGHADGLMGLGAPTIGKGLEHGVVAGGLVRWERPEPRQ